MRCILLTVGGAVGSCFALQLRGVKLAGEWDHPSPSNERDGDDVSIVSCVLICLADGLAKNECTWVGWVGVCHVYSNQFRISYLKSFGDVI